MDTATSAPPAPTTAAPESTHVRVRVTASDLKSFKETAALTAWKRHRENPLCYAINRTLRDGYSATFDGMSVGIIKSDSIDYPNCPSSGVPDTNLLTEHNRYGSAIYHARVMASDGSAPFYRGASPEAQQKHKLALASRKVKPYRLTVSLPTKCLKRTENASLLETTLGD